MAIWNSNGSDTGGSGAYLSGTQGVQYILANFAQTGDTITLPAGTFNWGNGTGSTPGTQATTTVTISVTIQGVQPGQPGNTAPESSFTTIIQNKLVNGYLLACTAPSNGHITIAYICFKQLVNNDATGFALMLDRSDMNAGQTALVTSPYTCLVHDCYFDTVNIFTFMVDVLCIGVVIWQCTFDASAATPLGATGINCSAIKYGPLLNWSVPDSFGASPTAFGTGDTNSGWCGVAGLNNSYIENCFFLNATTGCCNWDSNSRVVCRHCVFQDSPFETHGGTSQFAGRGFELYSNNFKNVNATALNNNGWIGVRSSTLWCHDCTFDLVTSKAPMGLTVEQINRANFGGPPQTVYPANRQVGYGWSLAQQNAIVTLTGNISGTSVTGLSSVAALYVGHQVSGTGISAGTLISAIVSPTSITLSASATTGTGVSITFTGVPFGFPPYLNQLGSSGGNAGFGYGQQINPCVLWNNTGTGAPTAANTYIVPYTPDTLGTNLTPSGTIYFNQQASTFSSAAVASIPATFPGTQNSNVLYPGAFKNDLLLCMLSWSGSATSVSVTDSTSQTWTQIGTTFVAATGISQAIFAAINTATTSTATVTAHFVPNVTVVGMNIADYAGNWPSVTQLNNALNIPTTDPPATVVNQNSNSSSSSLTTGTITTTNQSGGNDLIIAWVRSQSTPTGVSAGFTQQAFDATNNFGFFDNIGTGSSAGFLATTGTFGLTATTTAPWTVSMVAFQSMPFLLNGRDCIFATAAPTGYTPFTYPHPLTQSTTINPSLSGSITVTGTPNPTFKTAANGLTAFGDAAIVRTIVGATGGTYPIPANNWVSLYSSQFGTAKNGSAIEWSGGSYARQAMGPNASGWTIAAYANSVGVVFNNTNLIGFPGVLTAQTLFSLGFCDALSGGNIDLFIDIVLSVNVPIGLSVTLPALTGAVFTTY